jgi:hypothetical protein
LPCGSRGRPCWSQTDWEEAEVLEEAHDSEELIERVAALDIGKAELVCCVRAEP